MSAVSKTNPLDRAFEAFFDYFDVATASERRLFVIACGIVMGCAAALTIFFVDHFWILDAQGKPLVRDFIAYWSAGGEALRGHAAQVYDPRLEHAVEARTLRSPFLYGLGWTYPPQFLFVAALLGALPYALAFVAWSVSTLTLYGLVVAHCAGDRKAFVYALLGPWTFLCLWVGQNGFLTAALLGASLLLLHSRPRLAGLMLGLLSYKPQLGLLVPLALAAAGYWRTFFWAAGSVLGFNALAGLAFGFDTVTGFFHELSFASQTHLGGSAFAWRKLQSLYGLVRDLGGGLIAALTAQFVLVLGLSVAVFQSWRSAVSFPLKAAILSTALVLATPYIFAYDLTVLAISIAFLRRAGAFDRTEFLLLGAIVPFVLGFLFIPVPTGFGASVTVAVIIGRRLWSFRRSPNRPSHAPDPARVVPI